MRIRRDEVMVVNNRLTQVGFSFNTDKRWRRKAVFECDCGERVVASISNVKNGSTSSCGCVRKEVLKHQNHRTTHGMSDSSEYKIWSGIKDRCLNVENKDYEKYGGRGISICDRWRNSFECFIADMGNRPTKQHSIDRKDNNKGYGPVNCHWATEKEQQRNRRSNRILTLDGESKCISEWAEEYGISAQRIGQRLKSGWSPDRAVRAEIQKR